tara:strand:+ start:1667 stop:1861 length:195 start_codon:yes stop_codon:yes gene_type:complete
MEKHSFGIPLVDQEEELDITNFSQMYYANCREREAFGEPILSQEEYEKHWRSLILMEKKKNGKI